MAFQKITFPSSTLTAVNFGALFAGTLSDGSVDGCEVSYSGGTLTITAGYLVACGRLIYTNASLTQTVTGTGVRQVLLVIDASGTGSLTVKVQDEATLTQEDSNNGSDTDYELELAAIDMSTGTMIRSLPVAGAKHTGLSSDQTRTITVGTADPSGGSDGDIYIKYTAQES